MSNVHVSCGKEEQNLNQVGFLPHLGAQGTRCRRRPVLFPSAAMADQDGAIRLSPEEEETIWAGKPLFWRWNIAVYSPQLDTDKCVSEMNECLATECDSHESIDDALRAWLEVTCKLRDSAPESQDEILVCAHMLLESQIFRENKEYVRTQIIHSLLQEDDTGPLHAIASLLFLDGYSDESTFPRMIQELCFPRLLDLINERRDGADPRVHRLLLQLMYEMSRVERLKVEELTLVDDSFVQYLFQIIEGVSNDVQDPYHYPTIRVLVRLTPFGSGTWALKKRQSSS